EAVLLGHHVLDRAQQLGRERVSYVLQQDCDGRGGLPGEPQVPRRDVVAVVELFDRLPDPDGEFRADTATVVDHPGDGHHAYPGQRGHIAHGRVSPPGTAGT